MATLRIPATPAARVALAGLVAAGYFVATVALAPLSYGPIQLRVAGLIAPIVLLDRRLALGMAVGVFLANLTSPFGPWDWGLMPAVSWIAAVVAHSLRWSPTAAVITQAAIVSVGVAAFPLGMGGGLPFWPVAGWVFVSNGAVFLAGWFVLWRRLLERVQ